MVLDWVGFDVVQVAFPLLLSIINLGWFCFRIAGGRNFSVGQRQLFCLARVLLRNSKIVCLDEATASVSYALDAMVQKTLRDLPSTMLVIAHRIPSVLDCDRVMVLENGRMLEFDAPNTLLQNPDSAFSKLLAASTSSSQESEHLPLPAAPASSPSA